MTSKFSTIILATIFFACNDPGKVTNIDVVLADTNKENLKKEPPIISAPKGFEDSQFFEPKQPPKNMSFEEWLTFICKNENPDRDIRAFNFGMFRTDSGYTVYLIGSKRFDPKDKYFDWTYDRNFQPYYNYFALPEDEYLSLSDEEAGKRVEILLRQFMETTVFRKSFFMKAEAVTTGIDESGSLTRLK